SATHDYPNSHTYRTKPYTCDCSTSSTAAESSTYTCSLTSSGLNFVICNADIVYRDTCRQQPKCFTCIGQSCSFNVYTGARSTSSIHYLQVDATCFIGCELIEWLLVGRFGVLI